MSYLDKFNGLVKKINSSKYFKVWKYNYTIANPGSDQFSDFIHNKFLPQSFINFYNELNGVYLEWGLKEEFIKVKPHDSNILDLLAFQPEHSVGCINFISIENIFISNNFITNIISDQFRQEIMTFKNNAFTVGEFSGFVYPFDRFDVLNDSDCMAFVFPKGDDENGDADVLMLTDYYADWQQSRLTDFESYLNILLITGGNYKIRNRIFSETLGDRKPGIVFNEELVSEYAIDFLKY